MISRFSIYVNLHGYRVACSFRVGYQHGSTDSITIFIMRSAKVRQLDMAFSDKCRLNYLMHLNYRSSFCTLMLPA